MGSSLVKLKGCGTKNEQKQYFTTISYRHTANNQESTEKLVLFYHNKECIAEVNWHELLKHSLYFQCISKPCFNDHKSEFVKVNIPASSETFKKVIEFVKTGEVIIQPESVFEMGHLAMYLQIASLQQWCLDQFTYNLNRKCIKSQLNMLSKYSFLDDKFKERALVFKNSGRQTFSGLYFLQRKIGRTDYLKVFCKESNSVHLVSEVIAKCNSPLHYFNNMLCKIETGFSRKGLYLFQFHILSGNRHNLLLSKEKINPLSYLPVIACSDKNLFVISEVQNVATKSSLSLSVFQQNNSSEDLELFKMETYKPLLLLKQKNFQKFKLCFAHIYQGNIYIFYSAVVNSHSVFNFNTFENLYLLTICVETLSMVNNQQLSDFNINLGEEINIKEFQMENFEKIFFIEKTHKLYIRINPGCTGNYNPWVKVLVFDLKDKYFYFHENFLPATTPAYFNYELNFTTSQDGTVYGVRKCRYGKHFNKMFTELRAFEFQNENLVETGLLWRKSEDSSPESLLDPPTVISACFV